MGFGKKVVPQYLKKDEGGSTEGRSGEYLGIHALTQGNRRREQVGSTTENCGLC